MSNLLKPTEGKYKPEGNRATQALKELRIDYVAEKMMQGVRFVDMVEHVQEEFGVQERQAKEYWAMAKDMIVSEIEDERDALVNRNLKEREMLKRKAYEKDDLRLVEKLIDKEAKILGIYKDNGFTLNINNDEREQQVILNMPDNGRRKSKEIDQGE